MLKRFTWYLHEYDNHYLYDYLNEEFELNLPEDDPFWEKVGRPFYEVELNCTLDTVTGEVKVVNVSD